MGEKHTRRDGTGTVFIVKLQKLGLEFGDQNPDMCELHNSRRLYNSEMNI